jgi:hypothetical protein
LGESSTLRCAVALGESSTLRCAVALGESSRHTPLCRRLGPPSAETSVRVAALSACRREPEGTAVRQRGYGTTECACYDVPLLWTNVTEIFVGQQTGLHGIGGDVALQVLELIWAADKMIEAFLLPKASAAAKCFVNLARRELFP